MGGVRGEASAIPRERGSRPANDPPRRVFHRRRSARRSEAARGWRSTVVIEAMLGESNAQVERIARSTRIAEPQTGHGDYGGRSISEGIYRYGKIPVYTGIYPGPFSHTGYFGFGHPSSRRRVWRDCRGSAATSRATPCATHARARVLEFAPLGATRLKADARDAPPFLVIGKAPVRTALGPARRAVALGGRRGVGVLHKCRYIPGIYHTDGIYRYIPVPLCPYRVFRPP